jgi:acyl-CoA thioester hydrolase
MQVVWHHGDTAAGAGIDQGAGHQGSVNLAGGVQPGRISHVVGQHQSVTQCLPDPGGPQRLLSSAAIGRVFRVGDGHQATRCVSQILEGGGVPTAHQHQLADGKRHGGRTVTGTGGGHRLSPGDIGGGEHIKGRPGEGLTSQHPRRPVDKRHPHPRVLLVGTGQFVKHRPQIRGSRHHDLGRLVTRGVARRVTAAGRCGDDHDQSDQRGRHGGCHPAIAEPPAPSATVTHATSVAPMRLSIDPSLDPATYPFSHRIRVRFAETDAMGVVHHGNYLLYLEETRVAWMRNLGHTYADARDDGVDLAVIEAFVQYRSPLRFDEELDVYLMLGKQTRMTFQVGYLLAVGGEPRASAVTVHTCVDPTGRPVRPPAWLRDMASAALG